MFNAQEQFGTAGKVALDSATTSFNTAFATSERLVALNLNTSRALFEEMAASVRSILAAKTPEELIALQVDAAQPLAERTVGYCRSVQEIVTQGFEESAKPFEKKLGELGKTFALELEKAAKSSPVGADAALAAVKSSIAAANSAYDQVTKATRKAVDIAEANLNTATDAAVKAVGTGAAQAKARKPA